VVGGLLIAVEVIREWSRGPRTLALLSREVADVRLVDDMTFKAISTFSWGSLISGTLCSMNAGNKTRGRGRGAVC
jgi:hypothetical protein